MVDQLPEPVALFDLDGTLADFDTSMREHMQAIASPGEVAFYVDQDKEPAHIKERRRLVKSKPGFWRNLPRLDLGYQILRLCLKLEYKINVLSKAPQGQSNAWGEKYEWCRENLIRAFPRHQIDVSLVQDKGLHYGAILVDDWPSYITRWLQFRPRGLVVMPAQEWNADFVHPQVIRAIPSNGDVVYDALEKRRRQCGPLEKEE